MTPIQQYRELRFTWFALSVTTAATMCLAWSTGTVAWTAVEEDRIGRLCEAIVFGALAGFLVYGNLCYQVARLGQLTRTFDHRRSPLQEPRPFVRETAPALTILVPSYKEEIPVIHQTLLSAALQDYPNKRVVLLLDDPPNPKTAQDRAVLWAGRTLPFDLRALLKEPADFTTHARAAFLDRRSTSTPDLALECVYLSDCFRRTAEWFDTQAKGAPQDSHTDVWFVQHILSQPAEDYRERAASWFIRRRLVDNLPSPPVLDEIEAAYAHLAGRFKAEFDVFERKQYRNLSQERNKAMNLNSYLGLMGQWVKPMLGKDGVYLETAATSSSGRLIPDSPYVITLDADSLVLPQYASTLVRLMEQPDYARVAVAQTPYSAFPNAPGTLERTAGATTDIQYLVHQGFTHYGTTFWVGANALLRKSALEEICVEERTSRGVIRRYIQDRTVIEDTESTVDLMAKGWSLYNYPERLAYSATPPDFGSLIIQRGRWANGGLIILPKLLSFLRRTPKQLSAIPQALLSIHYLTSLAFSPLSVLLLLILPFSSELMTPWMLLAAFPYLALYARDLSLLGYRPIRDLLRAYAMNLLLIPVHLGGALKSMQQALIGAKIPFHRTPKISGRTRTPASYLLAELGLVLASGGLTVLYGLAGSWIGGAFALGNAALALYGIRQFIGFTHIADDLCQGRWDWIDRLRIRFLQRSEWMQMLTPQFSRMKFSAWRITWAMIATLEMLSPGLASGETGWSDLHADRSLTQPLPHSPSALSSSSVPPACRSTWPRLGAPISE